MGNEYGYNLKFVMHKTNNFKELMRNHQRSCHGRVDIVPHYENTSNLTGIPFRYEKFAFIASLVFQLIGIPALVPRPV